MAEREIKPEARLTTNFFVGKGDGTLNYKEVTSNLPHLVGKHEMDQGVGTVEITVFDNPPRLQVKSPLHGNNGVELLLPKRNGHDTLKVLHVSPQGKTIVECRWSDIDKALK